MNNKCRYCECELETCMVDLGLAPLSNDYLCKKNIERGEHTLPLIVYHCNNCHLVQIPNYEKPEGIFDEGYKYFSSFSTGKLCFLLYLNNTMHLLKEI